MDLWYIVFSFCCPAGTCTFGTRRCRSEWRDFEESPPPPSQSQKLFGLRRCSCTVAYRCPNSEKPNKQSEANISPTLFGLSGKFVFFYLPDPGRSRSDCDTPCTRVVVYFRTDIELCHRQGQRAANCMSAGSSEALWRRQIHSWTKISLKYDQTCTITNLQLFWNKEKNGKSWPKMPQSGFIHFIEAKYPEKKEKTESNVLRSSRHVAFLMAPWHPSPLTVDVVWYFRTCPLSGFHSFKPSLENLPNERQTGHQRRPVGFGSVGPRSKIHRSQKGPGTKVGSCWDPTAAEGPWLHEEKTLELLSEPQEAHVEGRMLAVQRHTNRTDRMGGATFWTLWLSDFTDACSVKQLDKNNTHLAVQLQKITRCCEGTRNTVWSAQQKKTTTRLHISNPPV